jgi:hypothetical protein
MKLSTSFFLAFIATAALGLGGAAQQARKSAAASVNDTSLEVVALESIHQFQLTPAQMRTLRRLARETAMEPGAREPVKVSDGFRKTLLDLRNALADASNVERIQQLQEKIDKLRTEEKVELDDSVEITEAATRRAPEIFKSLSARQIAGYIALYADDFPDPLEILLAALPRVRGLNAKEWEAVREDVSEEVGRLVAGLDADKAGKISDQVIQLLIQARALKEDELKKHQADLEASARDIVGKVGAFDVIQHVLERSLAELLSNPRLAAALDVRLKKSP